MAEIRLSKLTKQFNIGLSTLVEFLSSKGVEVEMNPNAKKYDTISIEDVIEQKLAVVDMTASVMCMENHMPMYVFALNEENSIVNAVNGKFNGTIVTV